jgi:ribonuclease P protein component
MKTYKQTFEKSERLCSLSIISGLFEDGQIFYNSIFKVVWSVSPRELTFPAQAAFSVSKRGFRHAVTRNLIKRRMREVYRKNKHMLYDHLDSIGIKLVIVIIMKSNEIPDYALTEKAMKDVFSKLITLTGKLKT